jgi:PAS domain S-box-containing protein
MELYLIFTALIQTILITIILGLRSSRKDLPSVLFFLLMVNYTLVIFLGFWNANHAYKLSLLHVPIGSASGALLYFLVRFSFIPAKKHKNQQWLWFFLPVAIELTLAAIYWLSYAFGSVYSEFFKRILQNFQKINFFLFVGFVVAAIVFLMKHNPITTMNLVYKKQLKWMRFLIFFIVLFIFDETFTSNDQILFSSLLSCVFTSVFLFLLVNNAPIAVEETNRGKELLKEALNEREKAVVITNSEQIIEYVNEPFLSIIGYRHKDVVGRKPNFLQGTLTTPESVDTIRKNLKDEIEFEASIINYRKNGEAYICNINFTPIFTNGKLTHFVAFEEDILTIASAEPTQEELEIFAQIITYFKTEKPYLNKQLQVADIAQHFDLSPRRIGVILKRAGNQSFSDLVNASRVQEALELLQKGEYQHLSIEAIGQMCGFNSKSVFYAVFKKETGKTPSVFLVEKDS